MRGGRKETKRTTALQVIEGAKGRKVVPFTKELALRFIRRAYPDAKIVISMDEYYEEQLRVRWCVKVDAPGKYMNGISWVSLQDAFDSLIKNMGCGLTEMLGLRG